MASQISTIKGPGAVPQIAYAGHPLYYYVGDHNSGQTNGQGLNQFGARWYVLGPGGSAVTTASSASSSSSSGGGGHAYGY
jgi:hypothetical protein